MIHGCEFYEYLRPGGRPEISDWISRQDSESAAEFLAVLTTLRKMPVEQWAMPHFKPLGRELFEIRCRTSTRQIRIFGIFKSASQIFIMLLPAIKKRSHLRKEQDLAQRRAAEILNDASRYKRFALMEEL